MDRKQVLLEAIASTDRGRKVTANQTKTILAAVAYLEDINPNPSPFTVPELLMGNWRLLFTSSQALLGLDRLPILQTQDIYQCVRANKIYNVAEFAGLPLLGGLVSVCASFTVVTCQRANVRFERSVFGLKSLLKYRNVDGFIKVLESESKLTAIDFPITAPNQKGWLDTTYLDSTLRIGRGNEGSIFILAKTI